MNNLEARVKMQMLRNNPMVMQNPTVRTVISAYDNHDTNAMLNILQNVCQSQGINYNEFLKQLE